MNKNYDSLTQHSQHQDKWQKWRKDVLRHTHHDPGDVSPDEKRESNMKERKSEMFVFFFAEQVFLESNNGCNIFQVFFFF